MSETTVNLEPITFEIPINAIVGPDGSPVEEIEKVTEEVVEKRYKNIDMENMLNSLSSLLDRTDIIGYAAARNTRILQTEAQEYLAIREKLIAKYGHPRMDENGNETGVYMLEFGTSEFADYESEIISVAEIEHFPQLFKIPASEVIGKLSGTQILAIEWMLDWE